MRSDLDPGRVGANIAHARKRARVTQDTLAKELGVSRPTYISIESGQRAPTDEQLFALAEKLGVSIRDLTSLAAPDSSTSVRFRGVRSSAEAAAALDALEEFGRRYVTLEQLGEARVSRREPNVFPLDQVRNVARAAEELAATERLRLGLGDGPLPDLRAVFEEDVGLRIFGLTDLGKTRIAGLFAYSAEYGPLVGFNAAHDPRRARWTLCHEYAHFLTDRYEPEVTLEEHGPRKSKREAFADAFAARFLMPSSGLSRRFSEMLNDAGGNMTAAHLVMLAQFFGVSFQAVTQRLEELDRVTRGTYEFLVSEGFKPRDAERALGLEMREPAERLPFRYAVLVASLYARGTLSEGDVAQYLRTDRLTAREMMQAIAAHGTEGSPADSAAFDMSIEVTH